MIDFLMRVLLFLLATLLIWHCGTFGMVVGIAILYIVLMNDTADFNFFKKEKYDEEDQYDH